jgi:hypothetical protein
MPSDLATTDTKVQEFQDRVIRYAIRQGWKIAHLSPGGFTLFARYGAVYIVTFKGQWDEATDEQDTWIHHLGYSARTWTPDKERKIQEKLR